MIPIERAVLDTPNANLLTGDKNEEDKYSYIIDNTTKGFDKKATYPELVPKKIYEAYNYFINTTTQVMEFGADVVWKLHENWVKFKSSEPQKYKEFIKKLQKVSNLKNPYHGFNKRHFGDDTLINGDVSFDTFIHLICTVYNNKIDPFMTLLNKDYLVMIDEMRKKLSDEVPANFIDLFQPDIENSIEYLDFCTNSFYSHSPTIVTKVRPILTDFYRDMPTSPILPTCKYKICYDINSIVCGIINIVYFDKEEVCEESDIVIDDYVESEEFKNAIIERYKTNIEKYVRFLSLDILSVYNNVKLGWSRFDKLFDKAAASTHKALNFQSIIDGVNHLIRLNNKINSIDKNIQPDYFKRVGSGWSLIDDIYKDSFVEYNDYRDPNRFIDNLLSDVSYYGDFDVKRIAKTLIEKTFSVYFESITGFGTDIYFKEFDIEYDIQSLMTYASYGDYITCDFWRDIIQSIVKLNRISYSDNKFQNGEKACHIFALTKRNIWFTITVELIQYLNLQSQVSVLKKNEQELSKYEVYEPLMARITNKISQAILGCISVLTYIGNQTGTIAYGYNYSSWTYRNSDTFSSVLLDRLLHLANTYIFKQDDPYKPEFYELVNNWYETSKNGYIKDLITTAFTSFDLTDYPLKNSINITNIENIQNIFMVTFKNALVEKGLLNIEYISPL